MVRVLCNSLPRVGQPIQLDSDEAHHVFHVLRLGAGDGVEVTDGMGHVAEAALRGSGRDLELILKSEPQSVDFRVESVPITLEMSVIKAEAMEWVIEKAVELGVRSFVPVFAERSVIQLKSKSPPEFQKRWQKIADQALKQCGRAHRMSVVLPLRFQDLPPALRFWCDEASREAGPYIADRIFQNPLKGEARILIGPEGGWSETERVTLSKSKAARVHLGPLILRAETAAVFAISVLAAAFRKNGIT